jgi:hypothetical protein
VIKYSEEFCDVVVSSGVSCRFPHHKSPVTIATGHGLDNWSSIPLRFRTLVSGETECFRRALRFIKYLQCLSMFQRKVTNLVAFRVLTATSIKTTVFYDVAPCNLIQIDQTTRPIIPEDSCLR